MSASLVMQMRGLVCEPASMANSTLKPLWIPKKLMAFHFLAKVGKKLAKLVVKFLAMRHEKRYREEFMKNRDFHIRCKYAQWQKNSHAALMEYKKNKWNILPLVDWFIVIDAARKKLRRARH